MSGSDSSDNGNFTFSEATSLSKSTLLSIETLPPQEGQVVVRRSLPGINELKDIKSIYADTADLRSQLKQPGYDVTGDYKIFRFLLAHDGDQANALNAYRKYLEERIKNDNYIERVRAEVAALNEDEFSKWWRERCHPFMPVYPICGETSDRDLLVWIRVGVLDADRIVDERPKAVDFSQIEERLLLSLLEWMNVQIEQRTRDNGKMIYCIKLFDFLRPRDWATTSPKPRFPLYRWIFRQYFAKACFFGNVLYPEMDRIILVTNPTSMFKWFWKIAQPLAKKRTLAKIRIINNTKDPIDQDVLYQFVPRSLMPRPWGGSGVDQLIAADYALSHGERLLKMDAWRESRQALESPLPNFNDKRSRRLSIINKGYDHRCKNQHNLNSLESMEMYYKGVSRSASTETDRQRRSTVLNFIDGSEGSVRQFAMKNKLALTSSEEEGPPLLPPSRPDNQSPPPKLMSLKTARILGPSKSKSSTSVKKGSTRVSQDEGGHLRYGASSKRRNSRSKLTRKKGDGGRIEDEGGRTTPTVASRKTRSTSKPPMERSRNSKQRH